MAVADALARGDLRGAIDHAGAEVRDRPLDPGARLMLIDLLGFAGDWVRAERQVDALGDAAEAPEARLLVRAGRARAEFFARGEPAPSWMVEPPAWAGHHQVACDLIRRGDPVGARRAVDGREHDRPTVAGTVDGGEFADLRDLDDRLGPVLEFAGAGGYAWVAWQDVRFLDVPPPATLRDLLWAPARLALAQGPIGWVYLPTTYPGSEADGALALGRATDWRDLGSGLATGQGLKLVLVGDRALSPFEIRDLRIVPPAEGSAEPGVIRPG